MAFGFVSGILGMPVLPENETIIGVDKLMKWSADDKDDGCELGTNVPVASIPYA